MEGSGQPPGHGSGDPSHHMPPPSASEQPTEQTPSPPPTGGPTPSGGTPPPGFTIPQVAWPAGARLTIPGNAEWALWFVVELVFAIIWAASDWVNANDFIWATTLLTAAYLLSRGIAKASRVLEQ